MGWNGWNEWKTHVAARAVDDVVARVNGTVV
jgi:hypothetical protein